VTLPIVWALWFANAPLLYALAAAGVPVVIHLLNRRKYREVPWAAMRFLLAAIRKNRRRLRVEQWLLLAIRTLVILLVVTAMAQPFLESFGAFIAGSRTHRVIVLDGSLSMGYRSGESSRFDEAKEVAARLVKDSRPGDAVSVILMGSPPRVVIVPSRNLGEVKKEIDELSQSDGGTDLAATFEMVDRVLELLPNDQKEVVFLTDLQATSWRPPAETNDALRRVLARLVARRPRSVVVDLGKSGGENRAVTDLRLEVPVVTVGAPVLIRASLRNFGTTRADGVRVRLTADGRLGPEEPVDLAPGDDVPVPVIFRQQFSTPGDHVVEVSIDQDPLERDNHRWLVVPVRESLNVLLVDGHFKSEPYQAETDYLAQALAPGEESPGQPRPIKVAVVSESQLSRGDLAPYDVVVLCNVAQFSQSEVTALDDFLRQGGGLVVFGGDQVVTDNYNRLLFDDGKGLLPAALGPSVGDAAKKDTRYSFNPLGFRHPIVAAFQGETEPVTAGLTQALSFQYHKLLVPKGSQTQVALAFETGDPAIVEAHRHRGTVFLVATSADTGWTSWPIHKSYVPVMQEMVLRASAGKLSDRNIRVGQPFDQSYPAVGAAAAVTVTSPKGQASATKLQASGGVSQLHFEQTDLAGEYTVKVGPPLALDSAFAANTDPAESDLTKLDRTALTEILPGWNFQYLTNARDLAQDASSVGRTGELHRQLLYGLLIMLLLESFLAWKFGHHESSS
jgi:hypothetical protein